MSVVLVEELAPHVGLVRLNRPEARNALNMELRRSLAQTFDALDADEAIRCIVLTGDERAFSAGADVKEGAQVDDPETWSRSVARLWKVVRSCSKPVVAAVRGVCIGGGCELALLADILVVAEDAQLAQREIRYGIVPGSGATQRIPRAVGKYRAMRMLLTGETISGAEAYRLGLASEVVPAGEVLSRAVELARHIAELPPLAVRDTKALVLTAQECPLEVGLELERKTAAQLAVTEDSAEAITAFLEKRTPVFKGK